MNIETGYTRHRLRPRQSVRFLDATGRRITCERGLLWITQAGPEREVVLEPGDEHVVDGIGPTVIEALDAALFTVEARRAMPMAA